jgi:hypothetical protein
MPVTISTLYNGIDSVEAESYATGAVTPAANSLLVLVVEVGGSTANTGVTDSGMGLTWTDCTIDEAAGTYCIHVYRAQAPASPAETIVTFACTGDPGISCALTLYQCVGADPDSPIRQSNHGTGTSTAPHSQFASALLTNNGYIAGAILAASGLPYTEQTGWTADVNNKSTNTPAIRYGTQHRSTGETTALDVIFTDMATSSHSWACVILEIAFLSAITGNLSATISAVTSSSAGVLALVGNASPTIPDVTSSAAAALLIQGEASSTLAAFTLSAASIIVYIPSIHVVVISDALASLATLLISNAEVGTATVVVSDDYASGTPTLSIGDALY